MPSSSDSCTESESDSDESRHVQHTVLNEYEGFSPTRGITHVTDRISADIKPADFFEQYVKTRHPAVFSGLLKDSSFKGCQWTNSYLSSRVILKDAGTTGRRDRRRDSFGQKWAVVQRLCVPSSY